LDGGASAMLEDEGVATTNEIAEEVIISITHGSGNAVVVLLKQAL
jgi:hypothetical protein